MKRFRPRTNISFHLDNTNVSFIGSTGKPCFVLLSETCLRRLVGWGRGLLLPSPPTNPGSDRGDGGRAARHPNGNRRPEAHKWTAPRHQKIFRKWNWNLLHTNRWRRRVNTNFEKINLITKKLISHQLGFLSIHVCQHCILECPARKIICGLRNLLLHRSKRKTGSKIKFLSM